MSDHQTLKPRQRTLDNYKISLWDDHSILQFTLQSQLDNFAGIDGSRCGSFILHWDFPWKISYYDITTGAHVITGHQGDTDASYLAHRFLSDYLRESIHSRPPRPSKQPEHNLVLRGTPTTLID